MNDTTQARKRLNEKTWQGIQTCFEVGTHSAKRLSIEYGISTSTIHRRKRKEGWLEYGERGEQAAAQARQEIAADMTDEYKAMAKVANKRHLKLYAEIQIIGIDFMGQLEKNLKEPDPKKHKAISKEVSALQALTSALKIAIDGERNVLNIDALNMNQTRDGFDRLCEILERRQLQEQAQERDKEPTQQDEMVH